MNGEEVRAPLEELVGIPFTEGNAVQVLRNGDEIFPCMLQMIGSATRSVDFANFIWNSGAITEEVSSALAERARRGVRVRVLLDGFGALHAEDRQLRRMSDAGCEVAIHHPLPTWRVSTMNRRMHQRIVVCDGVVGLTGGMGIDRVWTGDARSPGSWRDTALAMRGPAVAGLRGTFARDWLQTPHPLTEWADPFRPIPPVGAAAAQIVTSRSGPGLTSAALATVALLRTARHRVRIATPYVRLPPRMHDLLAATATRGVQVQIMLNGPHADRPFVQLQSQHRWQRLLDSGVELWLYQPTMLHAKVTTVDNRLGMVGTINLDIRAFTLNSQVGVVVDDPATTAVLDAHLDDDLAGSHRLDEREWRRRGLGRRLREMGADLVATPLRGGFGAAGLTAPRP